MQCVFVSLLALASTTPAGFNAYTPDVVWSRQATATARGIRLELYASSSSIPKGAPIWFQTRVTNLTSKTVRFPKASLTGELMSQSYTTLTVGDRVLTVVGAKADPSAQVMHQSKVEEARFFAIAPGKTVVIRTESIEGYLEFMRPGVVQPNKGDFSNSKVTKLKPGEYKFATVFEYQHTDAWPSNMADFKVDYDWRGRTRAWSRAAPQGTWRATGVFRVTSPTARQ